MGGTDVNLRDEDIDLTNCDREPIHIPGKVQPFGALLAFTSDRLVTHASQNLASLSGVNTPAITTPVGRPLTDIFAAPAIDILVARMPMLGTRDAVERLFHIDLFGTGNLFDVALHLSGTRIICEFEPSGTGLPTDFIGNVRPMIERVRRAKTVADASQLAARQLRALTGYDRVMVYRMDSDRSGEVIAESQDNSIETSYHGLRFPPSDIPRQAYAMYKRNLLRIIGDVRADTVPIDPPLTDVSEPLDLTLSVTRAVSPLHLEYLRNMGVEATLVISILVRGELWGMMACHHYAPRVLTYELRTAAELFAQLFAFTIDQKISDARAAETVRARILHDRIMASLADGATISDSFDTIADAIAEVIPHDGVVGWVDGVFTARGHTPTQEQFLGLARHLNTTPAGQVYHTHNIPAAYPLGADFTHLAAGMLALPVSRRPRDYLVLFRREQQHDVNWAGNPDKPVSLGPNGARLQPRKSFDAWTETVNGQSSPWTDGETSAAETLRMTLLEVVLRMADRAIIERTRAQEQQELLIAELNHRVRNILKLIQGLVAQSASIEDVTTFTETIGGRIHALARAHDLITRENWNPASVHDLIRTEADAYLNAENDRVRIDGPDVLLNPTAFSTLALVIHEMMTNAMKYGALTDRHGKVHITLTQTPGHALVLDWQERGGPPVTPPTRRGFGTTIVERSVPYELQGEASIRYEPEGVTARFMIPSDNVAAFTEPAASAPDVAPKTDGVSISGHVLVVEDNLIIALDAEDMLMDLGASKVSVCATVEDALATIAKDAPTFALLDVNLGHQTSQPVAARLRELGIPFVMATGYGEAARDGQDAPVLQKPYGVENLKDAIRTL